MSIFYAQVIGLWLFLAALAMMLDQSRFKKAMNEMVSDAGMMSWSGLMALGIGLLIVISHNIWVPAWPVVVTLFGWILAIQGIMRLFAPDRFVKMTKDLMAKNGFMVMTWVWLLVGLFLIWAGFAS